MALSTKEDEVMEAPSLTVTEPDTSSLRSASDPECKNVKKFKLFLKVSHQN